MRTLRVLHRTKYHQSNWYTDMGFGLYLLTYLHLCNLSMVPSPNPSECRYTGKSAVVLNQIWLSSLNTLKSTDVL